jgi:8-oxo-dGTP diphosphatase
MRRAWPDVSLRTRLHEAVAGGLPYSLDTFRRTMLPMLEETKRRSEGTVGKPAQLYVRR